MIEEGYIRRDGKIVKAWITEKASGSTWATLSNGVAVIGYEEQDVEVLDDEAIDAIDALDLGQPLAGPGHAALMRAIRGEA